MRAQLLLICLIERAPLEQRRWRWITATENKSHRQNSTPNHSYKFSLSNNRNGMNLADCSAFFAKDETAQLWAEVAKASTYASGENVYRACRELHAMSIFLMTVRPAQLAEGLPRGAPFYHHLDCIVEAVNTEGVMKAVLALEAFVDAKKVRKQNFA